MEGAKRMEFGALFLDFELILFYTQKSNKMPTVSAVRLVMISFKWVAFCVGVLLNGTMVRLIVRHTPNSMRIYSNILLQTCATDIALLVMTLLFQKYTFTTAKGENEVLLDGLITADDPRLQNWCLVGAVFWIFFVYVSLFGYVSQFIYRYMLLNRNKRMSTFKYFLLLFVMLVIPLIYCANLYLCYYTPTGQQQRFLEDQSVADILGLNLSDHIPLTGYTYNDWKMTMGLYYIIIMCTMAYAVMLTLAFRIDKFLKEQAKRMSTSTVAVKLLEMNKQISRNLVVQASMPLFIYLSILFLLCLILFKIDGRRLYWLQHFNLLSSIPMFLPSAMNPIVSICIIKHYRRVFVNDLKHLGNCFKCFFARKPVRPSAVDRWAIISKRSRSSKSESFQLRSIA